MDARANAAPSSINRFFLMAVVMMPTPRGLVKKSTSPGLAPLFFFKFLTATLPVTAKPKIGSGLSMLCPPAKGMCACLQTNRAPSMT